MSRHEVKRFVYMCDGLVPLAQGGHKRCSSATVIDAPTEREADHLAKMQGWDMNQSKKWLCKEKKHLKYNRTFDLPPTNPTEWMEGKTA